jgi:polyisoprenoid-binding protein YceI
MKLRNFAFVAAAAFALASCGGDASVNEVTPTAAEEPAAPTVESVNYGVNTDESSLWWEGTKATYGHHGVVSVIGGMLTIEGDVVTAGNFMIDMASLVETDNPDTTSAGQLIGHLTSPDFFDVATYPGASFEITGAEVNATDSTTQTISGNLTIKDKTNNISFPANVTVTGDDFAALATFSINRNDWGVVYGSGVSGAIGDAIIGDMITFKVNLNGGKFQ